MAMQWGGDMSTMRAAWGETVHGRGTTPHSQGQRVWSLGKDLEVDL